MMNNPSLWDELVTSAVLGTERRRFSVTHADHALQPLLAQIASTDPADALLTTAAVVALYQRVGSVPPQMNTQPFLSSSPEQRPACGSAATLHLNSMLSDNRRAQLPEWLQTLDQLGLRVPYAQLPALLDLGRGQGSLRDYILPVIGQRGYWLAARNPDWSYAALDAHVLEKQQSTSDTPSEQAQNEWETGTHATRVALLNQLRTVAPDQARTLLSGTWSSEKADHRSAFLSTFVTGLSMDDEPLLEAALDDRSKEVRRCAANLLVQLPASRFVERMRERVRPLITWVTGTPSRLLGLKPGRAARIEVTLPSECDKAMIRDGIESKLPTYQQKLGEKAWWLQQMLRCIPPSYWCEQAGASPAELLEMAKQSEWHALLQNSWVEAALATHDPLWAADILRIDPSNNQLLDLLPVEQQEQLLLNILRGDCQPLHKHAVLGLLTQTKHTWSSTLSRAVLQTLYQYMRKWKDSYDYQLRHAITEDFSRRLPPDLLDEIATGWPDNDTIRERWAGVIDQLLITLQFRRDMLKALHADAQAAQTTH